MRFYNKIIFYSILLLLASGCNGSGDQAEPIHATFPPSIRYARTPMPAATKVPPSPTPDSYPYVQIASGEIWNEIFWAADSSKIFYRKVAATPRGKRWIAYDLSSGETQFFEPTDLNPTTPQPSIPIELPAYASRVGIAPSGERALYVLAVQPSPTPDPLPGASRSIYDGELWYWEMGKTFKLGAIEECVQSFTWSHNENFVLLKAFGRGACTEAFEWIVDLEKKELQVLFPRDWAYGNIGGYSFSPDDTRFLYTNLGNLHIYDIAYSQDTEIGKSLNLYFVTSQWIDTETLFITYQAEKFDPKPFRYGSLDLSTMEVEELINPMEIPVFQDTHLSRIILSPDSQWLVFGTGSIYGDIYELWLVRLEDLLP